MNKDIKWLKEELDKSTTGFNDRELSRYEMGRLDGYTHASMLLDELDELKKPIIPQFVADCIEEERANIIDWHTEIPERFFLILGHKLNYTTLANTNVSDWIFSGNEEKLYQALKYGYEVEKEKKWVVKQRKLYLKSFDIWREECNNAEFVFDKESTIKFTDKVKAEAVALLVDGTVEEVTE